MSSISRKIKLGMYEIKQSDVLIISWAIFSIVLAIFLLRGIIWEPGLPQTRDLVFPYDMSSTFNHQLSTWNDIHSQRNFELNKIPIYWVFKTGSNLLGSENVVKTFLVLVLFSLNFFIFISLLMVFKSKVKSTTLLAVICGIPSLFYVFNPWVVDRISNHIFMVFGMSLTPILVIMYIKMLEKGGSFFRYLLLATVLTIISMTSSHNIFYVIPLIMFSGLFYTMFSKNKRKILLDSILFFMMYVLLNSFWVLPVGYEFSQASIGPSYGSLDIVKLSELNTPSNLLRFIGGGAWTPVLQDPPLAPLSIYFSFLPIFFSLFAIFLFPKNIFVLLLGVLFCILYILSLGTNSPLPLYEWLSTTAFSGILWLYRDPSRLIQYMIMVCSILLAFTLYRVTSSSFTRFRKAKSSLLYVIMASILMSPAMFTFLNEGGDRLISQELPPHYKEVYNFFSNDTDYYKILWLPLRQYFDYNWSNKSDVTADVYSLSSPKSTYRISTESSVNNTLLLRYMINNQLLEYRTNEIGLYLRLYDIKYVVVHSDLEGALSTEPEKTLKVLGFQKDMKLVKQEGPYYIFENLHYDINAGKFLILHEEQNIEELTSLPPSNKTRDDITIDDLRLWNKSENSQVSLDRKRGESVVKWQSMLNSSQNESDVTISLNNTNIEPFNKLEIKIFSDKKNKDQQLRVILYTNTSQFPLLSSDLLPGKWNKLSFDLRDEKILAAETGQELSFKNITGIGMQLSSKVNIQKNENYPLHIDTISFFSNPNFGPYDPSKIINKWMDKLNQNEPLKFIKDGPTRYNLSMNSSKEFILGFVEPFDPLWVIRYQDNTGFKEHKSVPLFSSINGYPINGTINHEIELVHKPTEFQDVGKIITFSTLLSTVGYLLWKHLTRNRDVWQKLLNKRINSAERDR